MVGKCLGRGLGGLIAAVAVFFALAANAQQPRPAPPAPRGTAADNPPPPAVTCTGALVAIGNGTFSAVPRCVKPKEAFRDCPDYCPEMVLIPEGSFTMGSAPKEAEREEAEGPIHTVTVAVAFAAGRMEVTRGEFAAFINDTGHKPGTSCAVYTGASMKDAPGKSFRDPGFKQTDDHPAVCVGWDDAKAYVAWLSKKTGKTYRLLSEAEWEYAYRAGSKTPYPFATEAGGQCKQGNAADQTAKGQFASWTVAPCRDGYVNTAPGGSFAANAYGLHDMAGNVWEWTDDCYHEDYNGAPRDGTAWVTGECKSRVMRGGSWDAYPGFLRAAARHKELAGNRSAINGFRVARTLN